jgi:acyl-CoA synthetase (AMP-forming)/AMP-acid ligase II/acyl carrier protein
MSPLAFAQRPVRWLRAISQYRGKTSASPNFGYELCVRKVRTEECKGLDLSSWTVAVSGAEPVRAETIDRFVEKFGPLGFRREAFYPAFGMAEATVMVSGGTRLVPAAVRAFSSLAFRENRVEPAGDGRADRDVQRLVSCGRPIPGSEIAVVDPDSCEPLPNGSVGEIWVRGPSVGVGYWNRPEETERVFHARLAGFSGKTWLRTGDLGFLLDGELYVTGRLKELLIFAGRNFYPQDIEQAVQQCHPALKPDGGAAFSIEVDREERLVLVQEVLRPKRHDLDEVLRAMRRALVETHELSPYAILLIPAGAIPKTSSGKTRRRACRDVFLQGELRPLARWQLDASESEDVETANPPRTHTERALAGLWSEILGVGAVSRDDDFFAMGGQSLRAVQLIGRIDVEFGLEMPLQTLFERPTIAGRFDAVLAER